MTFRIVAGAFALLFLFARSLAETLGLTAVSGAIGTFLGYVPNIVAALIILLVGSALGLHDGCALGTPLGLPDGSAVGWPLGSPEGWSDGGLDGRLATAA